MTHPLTQRFIELLEEDIARLRERAKAWTELQEQGAHLEDLNGKVIATAEDEVKHCVEKEKELQSIIDKVRKD